MGGVQKAKQEANKYLQELVATVAPADKLTAEDLLADIVVNETVEDCEKGRSGTAQHVCIDRTLARFKESPQVFVEDYFRSTSKEQRLVYQKMAQEYLPVAKLWLQDLSDRNKYFEKTGEIHENFQRCFSIVSAWDYQKLPADKLSDFLNLTSCATRIEN